MNINQEYARQTMQLIQDRIMASNMEFRKSRMEGRDPSFNVKLNTWERDFVSNMLGQMMRTEKPLTDKQIGAMNLIYKKVFAA